MKNKSAMVWSVRLLALSPKATSVGAALLLSGVGIAAWARPAPVAPEPADFAKTSVHGTTRSIPPDIKIDPVLSRVPKEATLTPGQPTVISLNVDHIAAGATVRLEGDAYVYTFGREALTPSRARVVDLTINGVEPGTYMVSISNPDGRRSGVLPLVLVLR